MLTPEIEDLDKVVEILLSIPKSEKINLPSPKFVKLQRKLSIREAILSNSECLPIEECIERVVANSSVGCPPAVPIAVAGEIVDSNVLECFKYYGINKINVVK